MASRWDLIRVSLARRFFLALALQSSLIGATTAVLCSSLGRQAPSDRLELPWAFVLSSLLLAAGSWQLERAHTLVRRERQQQFRRSLLLALAFSSAFISVQAFGLWAIDKGMRDSQNAQLGVHGFVLMFTALHGMHFIVAQSVLLWVTLSAWAERYDHEYYWGVTFAKWIWHTLGLVWIAILFVFMTAQVG